MYLIFFFEFWRAGMAAAVYERNNCVRATKGHLFVPGLYWPATRWSYDTLIKAGNAGKKIDDSDSW